ncbi:MAG: GNAT family N-acetyltransferase [Anaerolineae bacterium]|nr:GNAT family N-acetyltransferase [Anaerolineae bacterium]
MITIRPYTESDIVAIGCVIADTYRRFNLDQFSPEEQALMLGPFLHAYSDDPDHCAAVAAVVRSATVLVADDQGEVVGVLRGRHERLASLFVRGDQHRRGIGRQLVERFEADSIRDGVTVIRVLATFYAMPFYAKMGYKRSTGVRFVHSFDGPGLPAQPMRKVLPPYDA